MMMRCRVCGNSNLYTAVNLGAQKLTGVFPRNKASDEALSSAEIKLVKCDDSKMASACGLLQIEEAFDPDVMYGENYGYRSGLNNSMVGHLHEKVSRIISKYSPPKGSTIIDIGSNDATTLKRFGDQYERVGVDPTGLKFRDYYDAEIELIPDFFSADILKRRGIEKKASVITSFSMFYDLPDPVGFAKDVAFCLEKNGIWVFEQSYLPSMLKTNSFDTACHEHVEYYSMKVIKYVLDAAGLKIVNIEFNDVNGGSVSIDAAHESSKWRASDSVDEVLKAEEQIYELQNPNTYRDFMVRINEIGENLRLWLDECKRDGKTVAGLGASTKGNVLLQYFGITSEDITCIGEVNQDKFGSITPGSKIPIVAEQDVLGARFDFLFILPWHFKEFFVNSEKFKDQNLVFPLPEFFIRYAE